MSVKLYFRKKGTFPDKPINRGRIIINKFCALSKCKTFLFCFFQFKMKSEMHYGEDDCPVAVPDSFPKDEELHFEIEMIDFAKAKARKFEL